MATYNKIEAWVGVLGANLNTDTFKVYLTNATPSASADSLKADLAEITNENGYTAPVDITNSFSEAGGTGTMLAVDVVITASGGTVGPFRYAVIYDDTLAGDPLMCWVDYGSSITLQDTDSFTVDFGASLNTVT
jgi:hypothetical protein